MTIFPSGKIINFTTFINNYDDNITIFIFMLYIGALEIDDVHKEDNGAYRCNVTGLDRHRLSDPGVLTIVENEG